MKCSEREEYIKIYSDISEDNTNNASIVSEDGAEPYEWTVVRTAHWSRFNMVTDGKPVPTEAGYDKAYENPHANKENRKEWK